MTTAYIILNALCVVAAWRQADAVEPHSGIWYAYVAASAANGASLAILLT